MMTPRKRQSRIYWRVRGGGRRAYGDFRDYADVGGKREPLVPPGEQLATTDPDVAIHLALSRLQELEAARKRRALTGHADVPGLGPYCRDYLVAKKRAGRVTDSWLAACQGFLERAVAFFGTDRPLDAVRVADVRAWAAELLVTRFAGERVLSPESVRRHLFALSNVYRFAQEAELVPPGFNPVAAFRDKPARRRQEAAWLEVPDAALLLEAARTMPPRGGTRLDAAAMAALRAAAGAGQSNRALAKAFGVSDVVVGRIRRGQEARQPVDDTAAYPLLATFLLTGGRRSEVLGLELDDVSFDRQTVTFRPNRWRRLKTRDSWRIVPLVPQLEAILRAWVFGPRLERGGSLLFPSPLAGPEAKRAEIRPLIDRVAVRAGWKPRELNARMFRHTYCAARLQTLDQGAPVSLYTVSRELGHGSEDMVRRVYAHLGQVRHRAEVVEFRVEQHHAALKDRLGAMGFVTTNDTTSLEGAENDDAPRDSTIGEASGYHERARRDSNSRPLAPESRPAESERPPAPTSDGKSAT